MDGRMTGEKGFAQGAHFVCAERGMELGGGWRSAEPVV